MSQSDLNIDNVSRSLFRSENNAALQALGSLSSGATEPGTTYAFQLWADTSSGSLKQRNAANNAWVTLYTMSTGSLAQLGGMSMTGEINEKRTTVAVNATTTPIWTAGNGNILDVTGVATITDFPDATQAGSRRVCYFAVGTIITDNSNIDVEGDANYTVADGDRVEIEALTTSTFKAWINKKNGRSLFSSGIKNKHDNLVIINNSGTPNSQIDIDADEILLKNTSGDVYIASSVNLTVDITASGANGLDTGAEASNTWYHLWVIYNGTTVAGLISTSSTAPTMPSGYTYKALVGAVRNGAGSNFVVFEQRGTSVRLGQQITIIDGAVTTLAWTAISVTSFFPPTAKKVIITGSEQFGISHRSDGFGGSYFLSSNAGTPRTYSVLPTSRSAFVTGECFYNSSIYYFIVTTPNTLLANGWEY